MEMLDKQKIEDDLNEKFEEKKDNVTAKDARTFSVRLKLATPLQKSAEDILDETLESEEAFFDDNEALLEAQDARLYKMRAEEAMNLRILKETKGFKATMDRYLTRNRRLKALQDGTEEEDITVEIDIEKVKVSAAMQLLSLISALVCINLGVWPVVLLTAPGFLAYNYYWLKGQKN